MVSRALLALILSCPVVLLHAQPPNADCGNASLLCAQQPITDEDNTGANGTLPGFCTTPPTDFLLWYTFTTNSVGGTVNVDISGILCPNVAGMDNELSVVVLEGDGSCAPGTFNAASACVQDSVAFTLTSNALMPNTTYWVVVAGVVDGTSTIAAQCEFNIAFSGPGADIVGVDFYASDDREIGEGTIVQLHATGGTTWDWTPTDGLSANNVADPFAQPTETTLYTVTTVINGCTYSDDVLIEVIRLIDPPNTFTPNGDNINDTWEIKGIEDYPSCEVNIYDRWGQRVYRSTGYKDPFDGTSKGKDLPVATYYYVIELNQLEGQSAPFTGSITIVR